MRAGKSSDSDVKQESKRTLVFLTFPRHLFALIAVTSVPVFVLFIRADGRRAREPAHSGQRLPYYCAVAASARLACWKNSRK